MIKLKFDSNNDAIDMYRDNNIITSLSSEDFGSLTQEVMRIMREASPKIAKKQAWKEERKQLMNQLKIMLAIKVIDFWRWLKRIFGK